MAVEILVPFIFFATTFGLFYVYISARNRERMAMIERGNELNLRPFTKEKPATIFLRFGFMLFGLGIGLMVGMFLSNYIIFGNHNGPFLVVFSSTLLFGGLFMIVGYFIESKYIKKNDNNEIEKIS